MTSSVKAFNDADGDVSFPDNEFVVMVYDGNVKDFPSAQEFEYIQDPIITEVSPKEAFVRYVTLLH
jgi:hypothetical protein